jgi:hypothetical protein
VDFHLAFELQCSTHVYTNVLRTTAQEHLEITQTAVNELFQCIISLIRLLCAEVPECDEVGCAQFGTLRVYGRVAVRTVPSGACQTSSY